MNYAIVVDASCSLPEAVIKRRPIKILPMPIHIDDEVFNDPHNEAALLAIYASGRLNKKAKILTPVPNEQQVRNFVCKQIVSKFDFAICQALSPKMSPLFDSVSAVATQIDESSHQVRQDLHNRLPFQRSFTVSGTCVAGQGLEVFYADVKLHRGMDFDTYKVAVEEFKKSVKGYVVIHDLLYTREKAVERGVKTLPLPLAAFGDAFGMTPTVLSSNEETKLAGLPRRYSRSVTRLLRYAIDRLKEGLVFRAINISIAGPVQDLERFTAFHELQEEAKNARVVVLVGVMSLSASIHYGTGAVALGIAPVNLKPEP